MDVSSVNLSPQPISTVSKATSPQKKAAAGGQSESSAPKRNAVSTQPDTTPNQSGAVLNQPKLNLNGVGARNDQGQQPEVTDEENVQNVVDMMNEFMEEFNTSIHFSVHKDTSRLMMTVVNQTTGDVLKEIPTEEMLNLVAKIQDRVGILLDKKV